MEGHLSLSQIEKTGVCQDRQTLPAGELCPQNRRMLNSLELDFNCRPINDGQYHFKGRVWAALNLDCVRCGEDFKAQHSVLFNSILFPPAATPELQDGGEDLYRYDKAMDFALTPFAEEQILLSLPMKPLCSKDCRGLCPSCGTNLNREACGCEGNDTTDIRWAGLKVLRGKKTSPLSSSN